LSSIGNRKSIHVVLLEETHIAFKMMCIRDKLTMQEFLEGCISRFLDGEENITSIAKEISQGKQDKTIKRITASEADAVYRAISGG
jgi:hypothetical protein